MELMVSEVGRSGSLPRVCAGNLREDRWPAVTPHTCFNKEASLWNAEWLLLPHKVPNHMFHALIFIYLVLCVDVCAWMCTCALCACRSRQRSEENAGFPGAGIENGWATMYVNVRNWTRFLYKSQRGSLTIWDTSPAPIYFYFTDKFGESLYLQTPK